MMWSRYNLYRNIIVVMLLLSLIIDTFSIIDMPSQISRNIFLFSLGLYVGFTISNFEINRVKNNT